MSLDSKELPPILSASDADTALLKLVEKRQKSGAQPLRWHIPYFDNTAHPLFPTWSYLILGRPGSMKSTLLAYLVKCWGMDLTKENEGRKLKRVGIFYRPGETIEQGRHATWNDKGIKFVDILRGKPSTAEMKSAIAKQSRPPILFMGQTEIKTLLPKARLGSGRVSTRDLWRVCEQVMGGLFYEETEIAFLAADGMHLIDDELRKREKVERMADVPMQLNAIGTDFDCSIIATTQATQKGTKDRMDSIPRMEDIAWNSTASQDFYGVFGMERLIKKPNINPAKQNGLGIWEGDKVNVFDENDTKYSVPITKNMMTGMWDKFRGTMNCESRRIALWANKDGGITQEPLPSFQV